MENHWKYQVHFEIVKKTIFKTMASSRAGSKTNEGSRNSALQTDFMVIFKYAATQTTFMKM